MKPIPRLLSLLLNVATLAHASPSAYKVTWTTPSVDSLDSMPLSGRFGAGANVWVQDGSIWLYLSHNGAYDETGRLLKLGCVRLTPKSLNLGGEGFTQELDPATGALTIRQGDFVATLWFAGETLVYESTAEKEAPLEVAFGTWREKTKDGVLYDMFDRRDRFTGDQVIASPGGFLCFHRNDDHPVDVPAIVRAQGIRLESLPEKTTTGRVFGAAVCVDGGMSQPVESDVRWQFWNGKAWTGTTPPRKEHLVTMRLEGEVGADPKKWPAEAKSLLDEEAREAAKADELKRWNEFWNRSHIHINLQSAIDSRAERDGLEQRDSPEGGRPAGRINPQSTDPGFLIGRNYQLFRYMQAANRDGELPLLFNGGIFTVDNNGRIKGNNNDELPTFAGEGSTPDFRRWTYCYFMSQNQRWLGWPTLANGDADLLSPTTRFYRDRAKVAADRARNQGAEGVAYTESLDIRGLCPVDPRPDGLCGAPHLTYHFSMGVENAWMNLQAHDVMGIPLEKDLDWIAGTVLFYDSFYRSELKKRSGKELNEDGHLVMYPANGLEFARDAINPIDGVAAFTRVTERMLKQKSLHPSLRARLEGIRKTIPPLPVSRRDGVKSLLPAKTWIADYNKWEPCEMYAAWPYRLVGVTRPATIQLARDSWDTVPEYRARLCKQDYSWMANLANMAALASPEKAKERAIYKMANTAAPQSRFPAFFGPGHDWLPDFNWGGAGMTGVQEMLLAPEPGVNGKLHLFPAWPSEWDVDFKLHAPGQILVEASLKDGKLVSLKVTPASREKDIVNWLGKHPEWKPFTRRPALSESKAITASSQYVEPGYDAKLANDGDLKTRWASDYGARSGSLEIDLGVEQEIGSVLVSEIEWQETRKFTIEVKQNGTWKEVARGTTIGREKEIFIAPIKATHVRFNISESANAININEFQVFPPDSAGS